ncbi:cell division protein FtsQ/DivIB [Cellulomonas sp. PhB150]|uniref:cell division protein FtsQ/DivIB n=1 Tax=Cellulomonas sp. PhB150 TaxID=2485188 RepID=UPI000F48A038|nr:cell division protein FtsQ/DivIB [Cellulomonas sp. PhB150]ROS28219.1 cell division protein FtsQ [Cellulomonas sp. PhB150]
MSPSRPTAPRPSTPTPAASPRRPSSTQPTQPTQPTVPVRPARTGAVPTQPTQPTASPAAGPTPSTATGTHRNVSTYSASGRRLSATPAPAPVVSTTSIARFAERARARRTIARRQILGIAGGVVAVLALAWLLFFSPVLALDPDQVTVTGAGSVVAVDKVTDVVHARADVPLPRLDTVTMRDEILDVPGVREARVMRDWPHGISVTIVAREPVAAVPDEGGFALLDMDGVQVGRVDSAPKGLPVVDVPVGEKRTLAAVLSVLEQLPADLLGDVRSVAARTQDTVTMTLRDGVRVDWGSAARTPLKISVLSTILGSKEGKDVKVVDVSAPQLPVTR